MKFHLQTQRWQYYTEADGLSDNNVFSVVLDGDHVWFGTGNGVTKFYWNRPHRAPPPAGVQAPVTAEVAAQLPAGKNIADAMDTGRADSVEFWLDNSDEIFERWTGWKAK